MAHAEYHMKSRLLAGPRWPALHLTGPTRALTVAALAALAATAAELLVSPRPASWVLLVGVEALVLALVAGVAGLSDELGRDALVVGALGLGVAVLTAVGPDLPEVSLAAAAAMAWAAALLGALVGRSGDAPPEAVLGVRRPAVAGAVLLVAAASLALPVLRPAAVAAAVGGPLALLVLQLAESGPARRPLRRWALVGAAAGGLAATLLAGAVLGGRADDARAVALLTGVLAAALAVELLAIAGPQWGRPARVVAVLLAGAAIGGAPGGLVVVGVALVAGVAWVRTRFPRPAAIPQALIDLRDVIPDPASAPPVDLRDQPLDLRDSPSDRTRSSSR